MNFITESYQKNLINVRQLQPLFDKATSNGSREPFLWMQLEAIIWRYGW